MKKIFIILALLTGCWFIASSQVGIGTSSPSVTAILELKSSNKGLLFPRTNTATRLSMQATKGLMIYDTSTFSFTCGVSVPIPALPFPSNTISFSKPEPIVLEI